MKVNARSYGEGVDEEGSGSESKTCVQDVNVRFSVYRIITHASEHFSE